MNSHRRRICIVSPRQAGGGAEYQIAQLIDALHRLDRFDVYFLARHIEPTAPTDGYRVIKIGRGERMPRFGYLMDAPPLYRALQQIAPDVIYQRVGCGYTGICAHYSRRHGVPMIWHVAHDSDVMRTGLERARNPIRPLLEKWSVRYGIRHATRIVTQTEQQSRLLSENYSRSADLVVRNFHPDPVESIDKSGPITVAWVANLKPWKRPEVFVRLANQFTDLPNVRFVMAGAPAEGSGDRAWSQALMDAIAATPNLEYRGKITQNAVNAMLATSHVFVNSSTVEGFPNTFIQAWMRGVPIVSLSVNPDRVFDTHPVGICAENERGLSDSVRMLITQPDVRMNYSEKAREYGVSHHSMRNLDALIGLLETARID